MVKLVVNENQKKAIENLSKTAWRLRDKYYKIREPIKAILNKLELDEKNEKVASDTTEELGTLIKELEDLGKCLEIEENELKFWDLISKEDAFYEFLEEISNEIDFIAFYIGKVAARLEITFAYQEDVQTLNKALSTIMYSFFK